MVRMYFQKLLIIILVSFLFQNSKEEQSFTIRQITTDYSSCHKSIAEFTFYIKGNFSEYESLLNKIPLNVETSDGREIKYIYSPLELPLIFSKMNIDV